MALRQETNISSKFLGYLNGGSSFKALLFARKVKAFLRSLRYLHLEVLEAVAPKTGEARRALVTDESGRQGLFSCRGNPSQRNL